MDRCDGLATYGQFCAFPPARHELGERFGGVFGWAVAEGCLLPKDVHFASARRVGRVSAFLEKRGQVRLDLLGSGRELGDEFVGYGVDVERRIALGTAFAELPVHAETARQVVREEHIVDLRHGNRGAIQDATVERSPRPLRTLNPVGDNDMGVELRVAAAGVPVIERCGDQTAGVDLRDAVLAGPGERCVLLDERQDVLDGFVMRRDDLLLCPYVGGSPQRRDGFHGGEGEVEPGDRLPRLLAHLVPSDQRDRVRTFGLAERWGETTNSLPDPLLRSFENSIHAGQASSPSTDPPRVRTARPSVPR
ncbi:hypothetical protein GCM10009789_37600 [Kribbella sancticallisti]|uniref:Uncharacterized protein n=1 Tax=Kribbella sancticallisti TaxID=460087 RepID=A0ABP4PG48_9ACTN